MTRGISASTLSAIEDDSATPIIFAELRLDAGTDYLHTGIGTITWGSNDWLGVGDLAQVESLRESNTLSPNALRLGLSGISSDITDLVFNVNYYRRPCLAYLGALSGGALIEDPSLVFSGFIESLEMVIGDERGDTVILTAESELILFKRSRDVRYTDTRLQSEFSGDLGLEFKESVATDRIVWRGRNNPMGSEGSGGGRENDPSNGQSGDR